MPLSHSALSVGWCDADAGCVEIRQTRCYKKFLVYIHDALTSNAEDDPVATVNVYCS